MSIADTDRTVSVGDPVVELRDLEVTFGMERGTSKVVDDVDLSVERGEVLGVVGESGSGKSMLASSMLDAVVDPGQTTGTVTYHSGSGEEIDVLGLDREDLKRFRWEEVSLGVILLTQSADRVFNPRVRARHAKTVTDETDVTDVN